MMIFSPMFINPQVRALNSDLMVYWSFNSGGTFGTAAYASGSINYISSITSLSTGTGVYSGDSAAIFNSSQNSKITLVDSYFYNTTFSVAAWIKTSTAAYQEIFACWDQTNTRGFEFRLTDTGNIQTRIAGLSGDTPGTGTRVLKDNNWHHVVLTHDGVSGAVKVYVDNSIELDYTGSISFLTSRARIGILDLGGSFAGQFNGSIDEIGYWKRVLTANDVSRIYNATSTNQII